MATHDPEHHGFSSARVPVGDLAMHVARTGEGPPLVLLHGWPEFWLTWRPVMERLRGRFELIAPDLRGFGLTGKPDAGPSDHVNADAHAADLLALADRLGLSRFGLVGHDVGAGVAQSFARAHPERLTGLFVFNCPYPGVGGRWAEAGHLSETWYQYFHLTPLAAELVGGSRAACRLYLRHFLDHWSHERGTFDGELEAWVDVFLRPGNLQGGFDWYRGSAASRAAVIRGEAPPEPKITVPTRVLWGRHDPILKAEWADRLPKFFEEVEIGFAEEAGHFVHHERPDEAAAAIAAFFTGRGVRSRSSPTPA